MRRLPTSEYVEIISVLRGCLHSYIRGGIDHKCQAGYSTNLLLWMGEGHVVQTHSGVAC